MAPPYVSKISSFSEEFEDAYHISRNLPSLYSEIAADYNCEFLDTSKVIVASELDGVHPDVNEHIKLGNVVTERVKEIME